MLINDIKLNTSTMEGNTSYNTASSQAPIYCSAVLCEGIRTFEPAMQRKKILFPTDWLEASIVLHLWDKFDTPYEGLFLDNRNNRKT